jgi:glycosyltransferase involved in cell wall biosynthesis
LRIAIDTRDLQIAKTGTRTYLEEICRAFARAEVDHEFILLQPAKKVVNGKSVWTKIMNHVRFYWWKQVALPWKAYREKCDLVFCTDYVVPYFSSCATVPVFHDAGFWERGDDYNSYWLKLLNLIAVPAALKALAIVTVSESAKARLVKSTGIPAGKIEVVYEAPKQTISGPSLSPAECSEVLEKYGLDRCTPFILSVGVMEKRKNLPRLVSAFAQVVGQIPADIKLVLVGQAGPKKAMDDSKNIRDIIAQHGIESRVICTGYVPDRELGAFYQSALIYAFPSLYEGFGLPLLEAFANKLPVIAANATSLPEVAGDAAQFFDPFDVEEIGEVIIKVASDENLRAELINRGELRLEEFSWQKTAMQLMEIFERAAR